MEKHLMIWLSTMMVLSLILIAFYTVINVAQVSIDAMKVSSIDVFKEGSDYFVT